VDMRRLVLIGVEQEHPYQDAVEHGNRGHLSHPVTRPTLAAAGAKLWQRAKRTPKFGVGLMD
jgi:hypothetical protein